jgi:hypothetical protein
MPVPSGLAERGTVRSYHQGGGQSGRWTFAGALSAHAGAPDSVAPRTTS